MIPIRPTPARLTTSATTRLSRGLLTLLCLAFLLPGLIGRDPWKTEDVIGLGIIRQMADTAASAEPSSALHSWLAPRLDDQHLIALEGPLPYWVGAGVIVAVQFLQDHLPGSSAVNWNANSRVLWSRLANALWALLSGICVWYGTYLLGRRGDIQPMPLPFGGQPAPRDYGRLLADGALLLLIGSLGLLWRSHESSAEPAILAFYALGLLSAIRRLDQPILAKFLWITAVSGSLLSRGLLGIIPLIAASLALRLLPGASLQNRDHPALPDNRAHGFAWLFGLLPFCLWLWLVREHDRDWLSSWQQWHFTWFGIDSGLPWLTTRLESWAWILRNGCWFTWPVWPLAMFGLWNWRRHLSLPALRIPLSFLVGAVFNALLAQQASDAELLLMLPSFAMLAAMALPTLRRGVVNALDWFALMTYSFVAGLIWLGWLAFTTGFPPKIAHNFMRQTPGFVAQWEGIAFVVGLAVSLGWILLVHWRLSDKPAQLWRSTVLSAGGLVMCWALLMSLWLPSINYSKSYRQVTQSIHQAIRQSSMPSNGTAGLDNCLYGTGIGLAQRASFTVLDGLTFKPLLTPQPCRWLLVQRDDPSVQGWPSSDDADWQLIWQGARARDRRERFLLYQRR